MNIRVRRAIEAVSLRAVLRPGRLFEAQVLPRLNQSMVDRNQHDIRNNLCRMEPSGSIILAWEARLDEERGGARGVSVVGGVRQLRSDLESAPQDQQKTGVPPKSPEAKRRMRLPEYTRSTTLRWTTLVAVLFAAFVSALLGFIYLKARA